MDGFLTKLAPSTASKIYVANSSSALTGYFGPTNRNNGYDSASRLLSRPPYNITHYEEAYASCLQLWMLERGLETTCIMVGLRTTHAQNNSHILPP